MATFCISLFSGIVTYLFRTTGQVLGVSMGAAIQQAVLLQKLRERIDIPGAEEVRHTRGRNPFINTAFCVLF